MERGSGPCPGCNFTHWLVVKVPAKTLVLGLRLGLGVDAVEPHWLVVKVPAKTPVAGFNFTHWLVVKVPAKTPAFKTSCQPALVVNHLAGVS